MYGPQNLQKAINFIDKVVKVQSEKKALQQTLVNCDQFDLHETGISDYIFSYSGESEFEAEVVEEKFKKNVKNKNPGSTTTPGRGGRLRGTNKRPCDPSSRKKEKEAQLPNQHLRRNSTESNYHYYRSQDKVQRTLSTEGYHLSVL